jgi:hypothetical protein
VTARRLSGKMVAVIQGGSQGLKAGKVGLVSYFEELESRVTALEERIGQEAGLRASQDRDLSSVESGIRRSTASRPGSRA